MRKLILTIAIIFPIFCYAQVESLMEFITKGLTATPSLNPFSDIWVFHTKDTVYGVDSKTNKIFKGSGLNVDSSVVFAFVSDFFLDSTTSYNADVGIVHYRFNYDSNSIKASIDSVVPRFFPFWMDPISKIILVPDSDKKGWLLKKIRYNHIYEIIEEVPIEKILSPDSSIINWQITFLEHLQNWQLWRVTHLYYHKGSYLICFNPQKKIIKMFPFIPGGPVINSGYSIMWERLDLPGFPWGHGYIRLRLIENENDIYLEIIDTLSAKVSPLGGTNNYTVWGVVDDQHLYIEIVDKNNNKMTILNLPNPSKDRFRADVLSVSYVPIKNSIVVNVYFTGDDFSTTTNKIIKISFPYTSVSNSNSLSNFNLYQNYPNPFNSTTTIEFDIPERTNVKLIVYDILGREIETLIDKELEPGKYKVNFDATNLPSGVYFYTLRTPKFTKTNKMVLIK